MIINSVIQEIFEAAQNGFMQPEKVLHRPVLKICYDWAIAQQRSGNCVISGFHSQLEKDAISLFTQR